ncbi:unnamed protein product [Linum trigynum]|uniref:Reverse transcriptase domain-containing protein n=1 Tax=Linum trigynum TaxID=586398 RepID=A0AAV2FVJ9_9ROSI
MIAPEEMKAAVMATGPLKAPGLDGLNPIFFQRFWDLVSPTVCDFATKCWADPMTNKELNVTIIVLIPKVPRPVQIKQFRPISLCNVGYKIITKCLAETLKPLMPKLVHETQTSFVAGRHIPNNICILQEVVHSMRAKTGQRGWMAIKVYLAKAYDCIRRSFVHDPLQAVGLPPSFTDLTMQCITYARMRIQWNGGLTDQFTPSGGLRQGCSLSPYICALCMDRLSHMIRVAVEEGEWMLQTGSGRAKLVSPVFC